MERLFLDNLWRRSAGLSETHTDARKQLPTLEELKVTEWSDEFERLMRNRLIMGAIRYGPMGHGSIPRGKPTYNRTESIVQRIKLFRKTGNAEYLIDVANFALLLYEERNHTNWHFKSEDDMIHDTIITT